VTTDSSVDDFVETVATLLREDRFAALSEAALDHVERYDRGRIVSEIGHIYESIL